MAHIEPSYLDTDDDAVFLGLLTGGDIWIEEEDDEENWERHEPQIKDLETSITIKLHVLKEHRKRVNALVVSGDFVISASDDGTLCVYNWRTGEHIYTLKGHKQPIEALAISGDFVISASADKTLRVWNWKTGQPIDTLNVTAQDMSALAVDGDILVSVSNNEIWVWNWQTKELLQKLAGSHLTVVKSVAIDGDLVLSTSQDLLIVRNWKTGEISNSVDLRDYKLPYCGFYKDFAIFRNYEDIGVWNWKLGKHLDISELCDRKNIQVNKHAFVASSYICIFSRKIGKWCSYTVDAAFDKVALVEGSSHIITSDHSGWIYVIPTYPSLKHIIVSNKKWHYKKAQN